MPYFLNSRIPGGGVSIENVLLASPSAAQMYSSLESQQRCVRPCPAPSPVKVLGEGTLYQYECLLVLFSTVSISLQQDGNFL